MSMRNRKSNCVPFICYSSYVALDTTHMSLGIWAGITLFSLRTIRSYVAVPTSNILLEFDSSIQVFGFPASIHQTYTAEKPYEH